MSFRVFISCVRSHRLLMVAGLLASILPGCVHGPDHTPAPLSPAMLTRQIQRRTALLVTLPAAQADTLIRSLRVPGAAEVSLSTATPVSSDGFFLTSAHSVKALRPGDVSVIFYSPGKADSRGQVSVVWTDERLDLALLKAPFATPDYYEWSPRDRTLPAGTTVVHGGVSTGPAGRSGELLKAVRGVGSARAATHTLRLQPGDSGGPLLLLSGELVGINRAVAYQGVLDTAFFTESHSMRPDPARLASMMRRFTTQR